MPSDSLAPSSSAYSNETHNSQSDLAARGPRAADLARARRLALTRLASLTDDREGLTRFSYHRVLGQCDPTRRALMAQLESTASADVARAAGSLCLDTAFFMAPGARGG